MKPAPFLSLVFLVVTIADTVAAEDGILAKTTPYTEKYCAGCHNDVDLKGGLDLTSLKFTPDDPANFAKWVKVHDRLEAQEMPPKGRPRPDQNETTAFLGNITSALTDYEKQLDARE